MITYGDVKDELAAVTDNGITPADGRMLPFLNAAMRALANAMKPRGIFVGSTMSAIVAIDSNKKFSLPPEMDVAHGIEKLTTDTPLPNGWYNLVSANVLVDPDDIFDTAFLDAGTDANGIRSYTVPESPTGVSQLLVFGLKKFVPVVDDSTPLYIQNTEAIKWWLLSLFKGQTQDDRTAARELRALAVEELTNELQRHLDDPQRYAERLSRWRLDESTYNPGTLGNVAARMALDFATGQRIGRIKLYRMVNEAAREAVQMFNSLGRTERYSNVSGPNQITFTKAVNPSDNLSYKDYEVLSYLVKAQGPTLKPEEAATGKQAAMELITRNIATDIDTARSTARYAAATAANDTLAWYVGKMGLELPSPTQALTFSDNQFRRWINEAVRQAVDHYNFLGRTERYSLTEGPAFLEYVPAADGDSLSYDNYEVLSLLVRAQIAEYSGTDSAPARTEAHAIIERDLAAATDATRNTDRHARLTLDVATLGYLSARLGLEVPDHETALSLSDSTLRRLTNEAAREALQQRNFLGRTERYSNLPGAEAADFVYATEDTDTVSYPDLEVLRRLVAAQLSTNAETARGLRAEVSILVERNLQKYIEAVRNEKWHCLLGYNPFPQFGGARAQIGLEYGGDGGEDGYKLSDGFVSRLVQEAWAMAVDQYNFLSRGEDYEELALPVPPAVPADDAVIPFPLEVIKLYAEALTVQDKNQAERATSYKQQATTLVERNLVSVIERARRETCEAQVLTDHNSFGYVVGRLGLELPGGLGMSNAKRRRLLNEAEEILAATGRWKFMEQQFILAVGANGRVVVPLDVESIIAAEVCGQPVDLRGRFWFYMGCATRSAGGWEGWGYGCDLPLTYAGPDGCGNANYTLGHGCNYPHNGTSNPPLRALCRRKWLLKSDDATPMLIQNYPALKRMVQSLLAGAGGDVPTASMHYNGAVKSLDNQLNVETEGQMPAITVEFAGLPRGGRRGHHYRSQY